MGKEIYRERLKRLREEMSREHIDAVYIPTDDFHGSEYVGDYFKCREYVSGFDGSAGILVVTLEKAGLWTDGRYFIQAEEQLADTGIDLYRQRVPGVPDIPEFLKNTLEKGSRIALDGRTVNAAYGAMLAKKLPELSFITDIDLVDRIWPDRPAFPQEKIWLLDEEYTGMSRASKLTVIRKHMNLVGCRYHLMSTLDDIAWLYNFRGNDIEFNPVAVSYTLLTQEEATLYIAPSAVEEDVQKVLEEDGVEIRPYLQIYEDIQKLEEGNAILLDRSAVNTALISRIPVSVNIVQRMNPAKALKAIKNQTEQDNERAAHIKDGVAVTKLIYWLKKHRPEGVTELEVADKLEQLRREGEGYLGQSFASIIATGAHGAIVHYEPTEETSIPLKEDTFVLMDTGGHYLQGTTDITRTVAIGNVSEKQKLHYTAVLQGHLNLAAAYFKAGVNGNNLDYLARSPLWKLGLDFNHGTGHGVGYLLNVHEGPNSINLRNANTPFRPGMITSDEPGVYLEGEYGIRTENLILCVEAEEQGFYTFEPLTMVPYDREAVIAGMLDEKQRETLNSYHKKVYETISVFLNEEERKWLREATEEI